MRYALRCALVHLLGLNHTALHDNVGQVGEEQDALIEARVEQCGLQLLQYGNANEERVGAVAQHQLVPQMQNLVQWKNICKQVQQSITRQSVSQSGADLRENMVRNQGMANSSGIKLMLAKCCASSGSWNALS